MPILTTLQLENVSMALGKDAVPVAEDGQLEPRLMERTVLVFVDAQSQTRVLIPLDDGGRQELVRMLTGGIVVPQNGRLPGAG